MTSRRIGIDTGGTFTDLVAITFSGFRHLKVPSTPHDPSRAVLDGLRTLLGEEACGPGDRVAHGTTVATNALLTGSVGAAALVTTSGFEDVLEIGRQDRPALYDLEVERPAPLIGRGRRLGIAERVGPEGQVEKALEPGSATLDELIRELAALEPPARSVAVCLLHAYANPEHEEVVAGALEKGLPDVPYTLSSRLIPVFREYERTSTVVVNATVQPVMGRYLSSLSEGVGRGRLVITASSGGSLSAERAVAEPVHTLLSGPAAGVAGAVAVARRAGFERILTFDMGGTSTDVALCDGGIGQTAEGIIAGHPVQVPQVDLHTVGAGGGSLARVDLGGAVVVGPQSAGADPGPLAYGRAEPGPAGEGCTVTDANLLLGRLPEVGLLGGSMALDEGAARTGMERLAVAAGLKGVDGTDPVHRAAEGIVRVAVTAMAGALRRISVERGRDPRDHVLVAFGGAGGMHAAALAHAMGMTRVLVPGEPGLLSAVGTLVAGMRVDRARTVLGIDPVADREAVAAVRQALEDEVTAALREAGVGESEVRLVRRADLRYRGQSFELTVDAGGAESDWMALCDRFQAAHEERYGYRRPGGSIELVSVRVEGHGPPSASLDDLLPPLEPSADTAPFDPNSFPLRPMIWEGVAHSAPQMAREAIPVGGSLRGPALIHEFSATTVVPPGAEVTAGPWGDLLITLT